MAELHIAVSWITYRREKLSQDAVRQRFPHAPRSDDFMAWQNWLADLDPTERTDLQALANTQWVDFGTENLSLQDVRQGVPGAPCSDGITEWQDWLAHISSEEEQALLGLIDAISTMGDSPAIVMAFEHAEVSTK